MGAKLVSGVGIVNRQIFIATIGLKDGSLINNYLFGDRLASPLGYDQKGYGISVDDNYVYATGTFKGTLSTVAGQIPTTGFGDMYLCKFNKSNILNLAQETDLKPIKIFPNPCRGKIRIQAPFIPDKMTLVDPAGKNINQVSFVSSMDIADQVSG